MPKLVKEKKQTEFNVLPLDTTIDVVAITPEATYIFSMSLRQWLKMVKKEGVHYIPYQEGAAQFKEAIRTTYFNKK